VEWVATSVCLGAVPVGQWVSVPSVETRLGIQDLGLRVVPRCGLEMESLVRMLVAGSSQESVGSARVQLA
jgi:hypothetical protein